MQQQMYTRHDMDPVLERHLDEGEELLWSDRPTSGSKNSSPEKSNFTALGIIFGFFGIAFIFAAFMFFMKLLIGGDIIAPLICSLFAIFLTLLAILCLVAAHKWSPKNTLYAITNQRLIIIHKDRATTTISYGQSDLGPIVCIEQPDGSGDLIFAGTNPLHGYTAYSSGPYGAGNSGSSIYNTQFAGRFSGIPRVREVEQLLRKTFK